MDPASPQSNCWINFLPLDKASGRFCGKGLAHYEIWKYCQSTSRVKS